MKNKKTEEQIISEINKKLEAARIVNKKIFSKLLNNKKDLYDYKVTYRDAIPLKRLEELEEGEKLPIVSDSVFKATFCNDERLQNSSKFFSFFLDSTYEEILEKIKIKNSELNKDKVNSKGKRCDFVADIDGINCNIEMNCNNSLYYLLRNIEYAKSLSSRRIKKGFPYMPQTTIQFNFNNFSFEGLEDTMYVFALQDDNGLLLSNNLIIVQIFIPNIIRKCYTKGINSLSEIERFVYSLVEPRIELAKKAVRGNKFMEEMVKDQVDLCLSEDLRESYDKDLAMKDWGRQEGFQSGYLDGHQYGFKAGHESGLKEGHETGLKEGHETGLKEGHETGLKEGRETGLKEGRETGLKEGHKSGFRDGHKSGLAEGQLNERKTIIKNLIDKGKNVADISDLLDIPLEEVKQIADNII